MSRNRNLIFYVLMFGLLFTFVEGMSYLVGKVLQSKWMMYSDPTPAELERLLSAEPLPGCFDGSARSENETGIICSYDQYRKIRDPDLGWPYPVQRGSLAYDEKGAHPTPENRNIDRSTPAISLYGDSFMESRINGAEAGFDNDLAKLSGVRVHNFAQAGYGTDQAFLRFHLNKDDKVLVTLLRWLQTNG